MEISTAAGPASVRISGRPDARFLLLLTHGAGGGVDSADLRAAATAAAGLGGTVALVLQPYRVAGGRAPGSASRQDAAWLEIVAALRRRHADLPLMQGGRSNGARVACRTAQAAGAVGVVALAFPLHPPGRPELTRVAELREAGCPVLVVNGASDPFGIPDGADADRVVVLPGETHGLSKKPAAVGTAVHDWLAVQLGASPGKSAAASAAAKGGRSAKNG
jgi:predicted alpha/beta-hydrolase family hydrolase